MTEDNNKLLAEVNEKKIYLSDVYELLANIENNQSLNNEEGKKALADEIVNQELLLKDAYENGLDKDEEFLKEFDKVKRNMMINYAMHKIFESVKIDDKEIKAYYEDHKDTLNPPVLYQASHILIKDLEKAKSIKAEIDKGLDFSEAAKMYSMDPSKDNGGSLGKFPKGVMVKEFQEGLDSLEIGEVSEPVKSQFGYHIIKLENIENNQVNDYETIKDQVGQRLIMEKRQEAYLEKVEQISKDVEVKKYY
ncbi:MAG: peptidylprolyl isomerase [Anaerococcus sp.]|nr:peptidylprolyl isomerase [Anaerococcus sp.]